MDRFYRNHLFELLLFGCPFLVPPLRPRTQSLYRRQTIFEQINHRRCPIKQHIINHHKYFEELIYLRFLSISFKFIVQNLKYNLTSLQIKRVGREHLQLSDREHIALRPHQFLHHLKLLSEFMKLPIPNKRLLGFVNDPHNNNQSVTTHHYQCGSGERYSLQIQITVSNKKQWCQESIQHSSIIINYFRMKKGITILLLLSTLIVSALSGHHRFLKVHEIRDPHIVEKIEDLPIVTPYEQIQHPRELNFKYFIFEEKCYDVFFTDHDFFNFQCLKLTLSKTIGYALVYGSLAVKLPQIMKIMMNCSVVGISFSSIIIETLMNAMVIAYNIYRGNPFSIYGENVFLGISNLYMVVCFFMFSREKKYSTYIKGTLLLIGISTPLILQLAPPIIIENSIWLSIIAFVLSRMEQIRENHKNKSTGNLSFLTSVMNFGGNVARTFTILTEASSDTLFLISNVLPIFVNGYILVQFFMYWNNKIAPEVPMTKQKNTKDESIQFTLLKKTNKQL